MRPHTSTSIATRARRGGRCDVRRDPEPLTALGRLTFDATDDAGLAEGVRALVSPAFTFRQEGARHGVDGYLAHVRGFRATLSGGQLTVLDELVDRSTRPARAAVRFHVRLHMNDGSVSEGESQLIGILDDGDRLDTVHEIGRVLHDGDERPEPTPVA